MEVTDIVVLYFQYEPQANTVQEHFSCFREHSRFSVTEINVRDRDAADRLRKLDYKVAILHYSLFGVQYYLIPEEISWIVAHRDAPSVAMFQDEHTNCPKRFNYINEYDVDVVYTLIEPRFFRQTWIKYTRARVVRYSIPGYVTPALQQAARDIPLDGERPIDVGYRGRSLGLKYGMGGQEKRIIGEEFLRRTEGLGLNLDIAVNEESRIYGEAWPKFIASCKAVLGVEAGVSIIDLDDSVRLGVRRAMRENPDMSEQEIYDLAVRQHENTEVSCRTISPRHFEAAALGTVQILFEGRYSGIMVPDVHYIPLKKDFSNMDEVVGKLRDDACRLEIAANARRDLIEGDAHTYRRFVEEFDQLAQMLGVERGERA